VPEITTNFLATETHPDKLTTKINSMGMTSNISSETVRNIKSTDVSDIMPYIMNSLCKSALFVKMYFPGETPETINTIMISDSIMKSISLITITRLAGVSLKQHIANTISENNLENVIEKSTAHLPYSEVSKGKLWNNVQKTNSVDIPLIVGETN
jgi:hypothetical protein